MTEVTTASAHARRPGFRCALRLYCRAIRIASEKPSFNMTCARSSSWACLRALTIAATVFGSRIHASPVTPKSFGFYAQKWNQKFGGKRLQSENEAAQDGRIYIEKINAPILYRERATLAEYKAGLDLAIERGWLVLHERGTFVRFTQAGADLFA